MDFSPLEISEPDKNIRVPTAEDVEEVERYFEFLRELAEVIAPHFGRSDQFDYFSIATSICEHQTFFMDEFWNKKEVTSDLMRLERVVRDIDSILERLPTAVWLSMLHSSIKEVVGKSYKELGAANSDDMHRIMNDLPPRKAFLALSELRERASDLTEVIEDAREFAKTGSPVGNKAIEEWRLVDTCAAVIARHPEVMKVPKAMNSSGPFYRFLSDVFDGFGAPCDVNSAFRGWRRHVDRTAQS